MNLLQNPVFRAVFPLITLIAGTRILKDHPAQKALWAIWACTTTAVIYKELAKKDGGR